MHQAVLDLDLPEAAAPVRPRILRAVPRCGARQLCLGISPPALAGERWKRAPSFPGCWGSNLGRVASGGAANRAPRERKGTLIRGYLKSRIAGRWVNHSHVVADAFHGPRAAGQVVRHFNDDRLDDRPINLRYGTLSDNALDAYRNGSRGKLSPRKAFSIRAARVRGIAAAVLARRYKVAPRTIRHVLSGDTWRQPLLSSQELEPASPHL